MRLYEPDGWVCLKIIRGNHPPYYRLFGSWSGSFDTPNSWRLSSGFLNNDHFCIKDGVLTIPQSSGSVYRVNTSMQHNLSLYNREVLEQLLLSSQRSNLKEEQVSIFVLDLKCDSLDSFLKSLISHDCTL